MTYLTATLVEVIQMGSEIAGLIDLPAQHWPQPGQYLPCQRVDEDIDRLPAPVFPVLANSDVLMLGPIPETWQPGDQIACMPPHGHGFSLPRSARRVGLVPYAVSPVRLLPLVNIALVQGAAVALFFDSPLPQDVLNQVPSQVEILPLGALVENPDWPDYLAMDLDRSALASFIAQTNPANGHWEGQVLIHTPMPCRGVGDCGVCAVYVRGGWRLACVEGPVFPLEEVLDVAR